MTMRASLSSVSPLRSVASSSGFVLPELIVSLLLSALLGGLLVASVLGVQRLLCPPVRLHAGQPVPLAPSFVVLPDALEFHRVLSDRLFNSTATYVFGGRILNPDGGLVPASGPLSLTALPSLGACSRGLALGASSFHSLYAGLLGSLDAAASAEDFTILVLAPVRGELGARCLVQCRSEKLEDAEPGVLCLLRVCSLWDSELGFLSYRFIERRLGSLPPRVGVLHSWYRLDALRGVDEEAPAFVVFPDPRALPAQELSGSHFVYLIPVGS